RAACRARRAGRPGVRRGDQPGSGLCGQSAVVQLDDRLPSAARIPRRADRRAAGARGRHRGALGPRSDGHGPGARSARGLVRRRAFLATALLPLAARAAKVEYPRVVPRALVFPRDHAAHPDFRTEWWYLTGWLEGPVGFQITFFRARPEEETDNPSSFNPRQILFAHAALSDPKRARLVHDQVAARAGQSLAQAETERTGVWTDDWSLFREGDRYR